MIKYTENLIRGLGLVPLKEVEGAHNPRAIAAMYANANNAHFDFESDEQGNRYRAGRGFASGMVNPFGGDYKGRYMSGYSTPDMNLLQQAFGTTQLTGQQIVGKVRWSEQTYVDNSTTTLSPFSATQTGVAGNQEQGGTIPNQLHFIIRAFRIYVETGASYQTTGAVATAFNDQFLLLNNATLLFEVLNKKYLLCPLYMFPAGIGLSGVLATADTTNHATWAYATHGIPDPRATWVNCNPLLLFQMTNFTVTLQWEAAQDISGNTVISTLMDGQEISPVQ